MSALVEILRKPLYRESDRGKMEWKFHKGLNEFQIYYTYVLLSSSDVKPKKSQREQEKMTLKYEYTNK